MGGKANTEGDESGENLVGSKPPTKARLMIEVMR